MSGHELAIQHNDKGTIWVLMEGAEDVSAYALVAIARNANEDEVINAQADAATARPCIGMALDAISDGYKGRIALFGFITNTAWSWTPGDTLYLTDTAGVIGTVGTVRQEVGGALSATTILFNPKTIDTT